MKKLLLIFTLFAFSAMSVSAQQLKAKAAKPQVDKVTGSATSLYVSWLLTDTESEAHYVYPTEYQVNYRVKGTTNWTKKVVGNVRAWTITGLSVNTTYQVEIVTFYTVGNWEVSDIGEGSTPALPAKASAPTVSIIENTFDRLQVAWPIPTGITKSDIGIREKDTGEYVVVSEGNTASPYTIQSSDTFTITYNITYEIRVRQSNLYGYGEWSDPSEGRIDVELFLATPKFEQVTDATDINTPGSVNAHIGHAPSPNCGNFFRNQIGWTFHTRSKELVVSNNIEGHRWWNIWHLGSYCHGQSNHPRTVVQAKLAHRKQYVIAEINTSIANTPGATHGDKIKLKIVGGPDKDKFVLRQLFSTRWAIASELSFTNDPTDIDWRAEGNPHKHSVRGSYYAIDIAAINQSGPWNHEWSWTDSSKAPPNTKRVRTVQRFYIHVIHEGTAPGAPSAKAIIPHGKLSTTWGKIKTQ